MPASSNRWRWTSSRYSFLESLALPSESLAASPEQIPCIVPVADDLGLIQRLDASRPPDFARDDLPLLRVVEEHRRDTGIGEAEETKPLRILVVDDNMDSAELLSVLLEMKGHNVVVANSGRAAVDLALKHVPDVALVDIGMPGMDGYEVARCLRESPELRHTALVAVTGYGQQEDIQKSREAGFHDHLVKPVDLETLGQVVRKIAKQ